METLADTITPIKIKSKKYSKLQFIEANTEQTEYMELMSHIIPRFAKDNQPLISQTSFLDLIRGECLSTLGYNTIDEEIRISHPVNGCIPDAQYKKADELLPWEKTIWYERCVFALTLQKDFVEVDGEKLNLIAGGIKAYNQDNLGSRSDSLQHFKIFLSLQNVTCLNVCIFGQGWGEIEANSLEYLQERVKLLFSHYNVEKDIATIRKMKEIIYTGEQIRNLIGNSRLITAMPQPMLKELADRNILNRYQFPLSDTQMMHLTKGYFTDKNFRCNEDHSISAWNLYNLMTSALKSSYIDTFGERNVQASDLISSMITNNGYSWMLQ
jgi:hypothetical protein